MRWFPAGCSVIFQLQILLLILVSPHYENIALHYFNVKKKTQEIDAGHIFPSRSSRREKTNICTYPNTLHHHHLTFYSAGILLTHRSRRDYDLSARNIRRLCSAASMSVTSYRGRLDKTRWQVQWLLFV